MSKLNQIQNKITELSGDVFQKVADAYLHAKGYQMLNPLGSVIGADKVRKGTPDSLNPLTNGKYVFCEYTTQQSNVYNKLIEDLEKCFDESKNGIPVTDIDEVVFCHTSTLSTEEEKALRDKCKENNVNINIFGIGPLSFDLMQKYPGIARDLLGIEVDTGQIVTIEEFVSNYNKGSLATPLDTSLVFRDEEMKNVLQGLQLTDFVLITGRSGVGKSRLALECCKQFIETNSDFELKCIINRGVSLFDDLVVNFSDLKSFLIFVDDANRVNQLDFILQWLHKQDQERRIKIIATVRDYAVEKVHTIARNYGGAFELEIDPLTDGQIQQFIEREFDIKNYQYLERISEISKGNPRLAVMAAKIAIRENNLFSISDVSRLYEEYFESIKNDIDTLDNTNIKKAAGIVSFFRNIDFSNEEQIKCIENAFSISRYDFWQAVKALHDIEVFDMYENEAVRVSDQVLATYLFYLVFFKEEELCFSTLLHNFFPHKTQLVVDVINPVLNSFNTTEVVNKLKKHVVELKTNIDNDDSSLIHLFNVFWFIDMTETLLFVRQRINAIVPGEYNIDELRIEKDTNIPSPSILSILSSFIYSGTEMFKMAIKMLISLLDKSPEDTAYIFTIFTDRFCFNTDSYVNNYEAQGIVINLLQEHSENGNNEIVTRVFIEVAEKYLHTRFESTNYKANTVYIRTFELIVTNKLIELRSNIWRQLFELFKNHKYTNYVVKLIHNYCFSRMDICTSEIILNDSLLLLPFIESAFDNTNYSHCKVVQDYLEMLQDYEIPFDLSLIDYFRNETYNIAELFFDDLDDLRSEDYNFRKTQELKKRRIQEYLDGYKPEDYMVFFKHCVDIYSALDQQRQEYQFHEGLLNVFEILMKRDPRDCIQVFINYLQLDDPLNLNPYRFMSVLSSTFLYRSLLQIINTYPLTQQTRWLFGYYMNFPEECIQQEDVDNIINLYLHSHLVNIPMDSDFLIKYLIRDEKIIVRVTQIILNRGKVERGFANTLRLMFNPHSDINAKLELFFIKDLSLLEEAYFFVLEHSQFEDHDGTTLAKILNMDENFMLKFVEKTQKIYPNHSDFTCIWLHPKYEAIVTGVLISMCQYVQKRYVYREPLLEAIFLGSKSNNENIQRLQDQFLIKFIAEHCSEIEIMFMIFEIISRFNAPRRLQFFRVFLQNNNEFEAFKKLPLEPNLWSWSGSEVPILQERVEFLETLLALLSSIEFLEHRHRIERHIGQLRASMEVEKKRDFLQD